MKKAILATKVGMTQIFNDQGVLVPVTVLQAGPCVVTQVKTEENDGYKAVQVGFVDKREKLINKPVKGHFDKAGVAYKRFVREFRLENAEEYSVKDEIKVDIFAAGDKIDATAVSKGKGFQGDGSESGGSTGRCREQSDSGQRRRTRTEEVAGDIERNCEGQPLGPELRKGGTHRNGKRICLQYGRQGSRNHGAERRCVWR